MTPSKIYNQIKNSFNQFRYKIQIFGYISPHKNGEFTLTCYAAQRTKRYGFRVIEINRAWSNRPFYYVKNVWKTIFGATHIVFNEAKERPRQEGMWYNDNWGEPIYWEKDDGWFMRYIRYMNLEELKNTNYKYCAFDKYLYHGNLSLVPYIHLYQKHKDVEFLAKAHLPKFITKSFLEKTSRRKDLRDFFRSQVKTIQKGNVDYTPADIIMASRNGWTILKAHEVGLANRYCSRAPKGIDRVQLKKYLDKNRISPWDYWNYVRFVRDAKMDILGFGVAFPRDFHEAVKKMQDKIARTKAKEDLVKQDRLNKISKRINELLEKAKLKLAWRVGDYDVVAPTTRQEFIDEGCAMHNCIGGYFDLCASLRSACIFIRKDGAPFADAEIDTKSGEVRQLHTKYNGEPDAKLEKFVKRVGKLIRPAYRDRDVA